MKFDAVTGNGRFDFLKAEVLLLALVSLLLGLPMHLSAQDTPEPLVVPFASIPPFGLRDHNGDRSGFIVDLAEMIGSEIGVPIDFVDVVDSTQFVAAAATCCFDKELGECQGTRFGRSEGCGCSADRKFKSSGARTEHARRVRIAASCTYGATDRTC